jgi:hypothetical protein
MFKVNMVAPWFIQNTNLNQTLCSSGQKYLVYMDVIFKVWKKKCPQFVTNNNLMSTFKAFFFSLSGGWHLKLSYTYTLKNKFLA